MFFMSLLEKSLSLSQTYLKIRMIYERAGALQRQPRHPGHSYCGDKNEIEERLVK